jgi:hypothetical protein
MALRSVFRPDREEVEAENGIVAAMHPLAAEAGLEMLRQVRTSAFSVPSAYRYVRHPEVTPDAGGHSYRAHESGGRR